MCYFPWDALVVGPEPQPEDNALLKKKLPLQARKRKVLDNDSEDDAALNKHQIEDSDSDDNAPFKKPAKKPTVKQNWKDLKVTTQRLVVF